MRETRRSISAFLEESVNYRVLLILPGDIELCPCPKCFACDKVIRKNQRFADCCICAETLHLKCVFDKMVIDQEKFYCQQCVYEEEQCLNGSSSACNMVFEPRERLTFCD